MHALKLIMIVSIFVGSSNLVAAENSVEKELRKNKSLRCVAVAMEGKNLMKSNVMSADANFSQQNDTVLQNHKEQLRTNRPQGTEDEMSNALYSLAKNEHKAMNVYISENIKDVSEVEKFAKKFILNRYKTIGCL